MSEDVGRLNRAQITSERFSPDRNGMPEVPTYRASLYDPEFSPNSRSSVNSSPKKKAPSPQVGAFSPNQRQLKNEVMYRRSAGSDRPFSGEQPVYTFHGSPPPPPPPQSKYVKSEKLFVRDLRGSPNTRQKQYPPQAPSPFDDAIVREAIVSNASEGYNSSSKSPPRRPSNFGYSSLSDTTTPEDNRSGTKVNTYFSPGSGYMSVLEREPGAFTVSPIRASISPSRTAPAMKQPSPATKYTQGDMDKFVIHALNLQDQGKFEEAHFLLLKVERMKIEMDLTRDQNGATQEQQTSSMACPAAPDYGHVRPRKASLVLEEIRIEQQIARSVRSPVAMTQTEEPVDEGFESLSDDEVTKIGVVIDELKEKINRMTFREAEPTAREHQHQQNGDSTAKAQLDSPKSPSLSQIPIPAAHVDLSTLEEERERRKKEFRKRQDEQQQRTEPSLKHVLENAATKEQRCEVDVVKDNIEENESDNDRSPPATTVPSQVKETVEDTLRRIYVMSNALSFSDADMPSVARVHVDRDEAEKTLDELARRRREEMMNPTKSSRLPGLKPTKVVSEDGYTTKEGYLIKLTEKPRFSLITAHWHKRFFMLSGGVLVHLKNKESKLPRGMVSLENCQVKLLQCDGLHNGWCVAVESPQRNYTLFPESRKEAFEWAVAIENNAAVFSRLKDEEEIRSKKLARKKLGSVNSSRSLSVSNFDVTEAVGKDVCSDEFRDLLPQGASSDPAATNTETKKDDAATPEEALMNIGAYYDLLGVPATASTEAIKRAYYKLAKMFHPDKNTTIDPKKFALINQAFHVVQDADTRERYNLGERVKFALRKGVMVNIHDEDDGDSWPAALYIGPQFTILYWQDAELGSVLRDGFNYAELRFVQEIIAGEDDPEWSWAHTKQAGNRCLSILGQRLGHPHIRLELDTEASRDEILDGLRILRCEQSMLFVQNLEKWLKEGEHR